MTGIIRRVSVAAAMVAVLGGNASAQAPVNAPASAATDDGWHTNVYPILVWLPLGINIDVDLPPVEGGGSSESGSIVDGRFDGAYLGGFTATSRKWRIQGDVIWAGIGGDR